MSAAVEMVTATKVKVGINPWIVALTVTIATFMELLDTSIANVSLPYIAGGLGRSFDEATWVLTSYLVANAVVLPMSAWLSRVFGRKNYYMACVALFTLTSFLCGIAPSLPFMLLARVLQGVGGGGLAPVEQAILVDTFPPAKRAAAFALYTVAIVTAPALGPVIGGWITDNYQWRWIFLINIPFGVLSLLLTSRFVHDPPAYAKERASVRKPNGSLKIDLVGILLVGLGSAALEVVLDRGQIDDWFGSQSISSLFIVVLISLIAAVIWELRHPDPVINFRLLANRNFAIACVFYFVFGIGSFASAALIPQILQKLYGYRAMEAGLVLGPGAFVITLLAPVSAQLVQRRIVQPRILLPCAVFVVGLSFLYYSNFTLQTDYSHYAWARAFQGLGYAFFFVPLTMIAYSQLAPNQNNSASSITNFFRNWGGSFGIAFATTIAERRENFHQERVGANLSSSTGIVQNTIRQNAEYLHSHGFSLADSAAAATARVYGQLQAQAQMLAFMDAFRWIGVLTLCVLPLLLLVRRFVVGGGSTGAH